MSKTIEKIPLRAHELKTYVPDAYFFFDILMFDAYIIILDIQHIWCILFLYFDIWYQMMHIVILDIQHIWYNLFLISFDIKWCMFSF